MLNCPKCLGKLEENTVENVKVDICWVCEGIWFDAGELETIVKLEKTGLDKLFSVFKKQFGMGIRECRILEFPPQ